MVGVGEGGRPAPVGISGVSVGGEISWIDGESASVEGIPAPVERPAPVEDKGVSVEGSRIESGGLVGEEEGSSVIRV